MTPPSLEIKVAQLERDIMLRDAQIRRLEQLVMALTAKLGIALPQTLELELETPPKPGPVPLLEPVVVAVPAEAPPATDEAKPVKKPQRGHGPRPQPKLEVEQLLGELDEADLCCPACGDRLQAMANQVESAEIIDVRPRRYVLVRVDRQKYRCGCGHIETALAPASAPERAIDSGRYSLAVAAEVVVDKYADHLPLARQTRIMQRRGLDISSQALWDLVWAMATLLEPVAQAVRNAVLTSKAVGVDTTSWKNLSAKDANPFQLWCVRGENAVFFDVRRDKSAASFKILLGEYGGWIAVDMAGTNLAGATIAQATKLTGCWSHVFRKFRDAAKNHPAAERMCELIGGLFEVEARAFESPDERKAARQAESKPRLAKIKAELEAYQGVGVTSLDKAMRYLGEYWAYFQRYADTSDAWICNNPTERGLRSPVIGRRNHFGSKSDRGRQAASTLYTLVETAKLVAVDPAVYLVAAAKAARNGNILTPADFAKLDLR